MFLCSRCEAFGRCSALPLKMEKISKIMIRKSLGVIDKSILYGDCCVSREYKKYFDGLNMTIEQIDKELEKALPFCLFKQ
jgi:hypothetical protein